MRRNRDAIQWGLIGLAFVIAFGVIVVLGEAIQPQEGVAVITTEPTPDILPTLTATRQTDIMTTAETTPETTAEITPETTAEPDTPTPTPSPTIADTAPPTLAGTPTPTSRSRVRESILIGTEITPALRGVPGANATPSGQADATPTSLSRVRNSITLEE